MNKNRIFYFNINDRVWSIEQVGQDKLIELNPHLKNEGLVFGTTCFETQTIYLYDELSVDQMDKTLLHELMHCYIGSYITFQNLDYSEELLCDISANAHNIIHDIVTKYWEEAE